MPWSLLFKKPDLPAWIIRLNYIALLPILFWPLIFFGSIFIFDNPKDKTLAAALFILINSYPLLLLGNMRLSFKLFPTRRTLSVILALAPSVLFLCLVVYFLI